VLLLLLLAGEEGCISGHQICEQHEEALQLVSSSSSSSSSQQSKLSIKARRRGRHPRRRRSSSRVKLIAVNTITEGGERREAFSSMAAQIADSLSTQKLFQ
jgi:hypothetical protein